MDECNSETWQFTVRPGQADRVYLVTDGPTTPSRWIPMHQLEDQPGVWTMTTEIAPGRTRMRYFTEDKGAFLNCGNLGLLGKRMSKPSPVVQIDGMGMAASA